MYMYKHVQNVPMKSWFWVVLSFEKDADDTLTMTPIPVKQPSPNNMVNWPLNYELYHVIIIRTLTC